MSVIKNKRNESGMQFLDNMKKLHAFTIAFCMKCPKRWDRFLTEDIAKLTNSALIHLKSGNSIYPTNQYERQLRKVEFTKALGDLQALITLIDNLFDYCNSSETDFKIKISKIENWMLMIDEEIGLVKGMIKKDSLRYKNLPPICLLENKEDF